MVMSVMETAFYAGFALGPVFGNLLYDIMGFQLPFITLGFLNIIFSWIMGVAMPDAQSQNDFTSSGCQFVYKNFFQVA